MIKLCYLSHCQQTVWRVKNNQQGTENGGEHVGLWFVIMVTSMSTVQFSWLCLHPCPPPPALYVHRQPRGEKGARSRSIPCHHPPFPQYYRAMDVYPLSPRSSVPLSSTLPQPTCTHPPTHPPISPPPALLPDSACKSAPWMMDYSVTAACEGLICFIDFSLGKMPASAASHLFPKTRSCNRR